MNKFFAISLFLFSALLTNAQSSIAHLNSQEVMAAMPSYKEALQKLEQFQNSAVVELQEMQKDFDENLTIYQEMVAKGGSQTLIQIQAQKLEKKQVALQQREQTIQSEIEAYSRELNYPIITKVEKAVNIVADRHNYLYVFDISTLMIYKGPDITKEVIEEVNKLKNIPPPPQEEIKAIMPPPQEVIEEKVTRP